MNRAFDRDVGVEDEEAQASGGAGGEATAAATKAKNIETPRVDIGDAVSKLILHPNYIRALEAELAYSLWFGARG